MRAAVRLQDNTSKAHRIVMKFRTQNCLINISVEFEDEKDPQEMAELSKKWPLLTRPSLRGGTGFFSKNISLIIIHNIYESTQLLTLILNLILVLNQIVVF